MTVVLFSQNFVVFNHSLLFFSEIWFIFTLTAWIVPQGFGASVHVLMGERKENVFFVFVFYFWNKNFSKKVNKALLRCFSHFQGVMAMWSAPVVHRLSSERLLSASRWTREVL